MRFLNVPFSFSNSTLSADRSSDPMHVGTQYNIAVQVTVVKDSSIDGDFKLQVSCDEELPGATAAQRAAGVSNWTDLPASSQEILDSGTLVWNISNIGFEYIRIVYTRVSGSGSVTARISGRGA